jgi:hypothetical protein
VSLEGGSWKRETDNALRIGYRIGSGSEKHCEQDAGSKWDGLNTPPPKVGLPYPAVGRSSGEHATD